jgi:hypothetical protein
VNIVNAIDIWMKQISELYICSKDIVTCLLEADIAETKKMSVATEWLCRHFTKETKSRACCNRGTAGSSVLS